MKNWKRNAVTAVVLMFVCAGVYLNWSYNQQNTTNLADTLDAQKVMGENLVLSNDGAVTETGGEEGGSAVNDYFAEVRLSRQTARDSAVETLQETISYAGEEEDVSEVSGQLNSIVNDALAESQIESLVVAKGYEECVAYMNEDNISIAVSAPAEGLSATDVALISDIVTSQSDYTLSQIRVIEVK